MNRTQSLAGALPYWTVLAIPAPNAPGGHVHCLVLKDGTVVVGLQLRGLDLYAAHAGELDAHCAAIRRALGGLPDGGLWQTRFASGFDFRGALSSFAEGSAANSPPLVSHGRALRHAALQQSTAQARVNIVHWVGQKQLLKGLAARPSARDLAHNTALAKRKCETLWEHLGAVVAGLAASGYAPQLLGRAQVHQECAQALYGAQANPMPLPSDLLAPDDIVAHAKGAPRPFGQANLDVQLAEGELDVGEDTLRWRPQQLVLQASCVQQMGDVTHAKVLHALLYEQAPTSPFVLSVTHEKTDQILERERLQQRRKWLFALIGGHFLNHEAKQAYEQTEQILAELTGEGAQIFRTNITCVVSGASDQAVAQQTHDAQTALREQNMRLSVQRERQLPAFLGSLPGNGGKAPVHMSMLDANCAHLVPTWLPSQGDEDADVVLGNRQRGLFGLSIRLRKRNDASAIVVGKTGSGKTFLFSFLAKYGCLDLGGHVVLADNKGPQNSSYRPLCELLGGTYVHLDADEAVSFNPFPARSAVFDAQGEVRAQRVYVLEQIIAMMVKDALAPEHEDYVRSVVSDVVRWVYAQAKHHDRPLLLSDAVAGLDAYAPRNENLRAVAARVRERLEFWCEDPVRRRLFNTPAVLDTSNRFCVFDFHGLDRDPVLSGVLISAFAGRIEEKLRDLPVSLPKLFAFDEAWAMFDQSPEATQLLNRLYRTVRSYGACCYVLTQSYRDIVGSKAASGIMANLAMVYLMRHQDDHAGIADLFGLNDRQLELFRSLRIEPGAYAETMLIDANRQQTHVLHYAPLPFDLWCDTSRAQDVAFRRRCQEESGASLTDIIPWLAEVAPKGAPGAPAEQQILVNACRIYFDSMNSAVESA